MSENSYHHGDLKSALLQAARHILLEKNIEALSLRAIAADVGVSHTAPYSHFKNKSQLYRAVAASGFNELGYRMEQVKKDQPPAKELILLYGVQYIEFAVSNPQMYRLMLSQAYAKQSSLITKTDEQKTDELQDAFLRPYILLRDGLSQYESNSSKLKIKAQGSWALVHGIASLMIEGYIQIEEGMSTKDFLATATPVQKI